MNGFIGGTTISVSTRSRPKAAELGTSPAFLSAIVSTRSRPKAADSSAQQTLMLPVVSTRSRPKAADPVDGVSQIVFGVSTRSRPKAAEGAGKFFAASLDKFQHAAARRRLSLWCQ